MALSACAATSSDGEDEDDGTRAPQGPACFAYESAIELETKAVQDVDIVFAIDNTESMQGEQESLAREFPRMLTALATGDRNDDGVADFAPASSVHLAVVSTDLGLPGVDGIEGCSGSGDDGHFNREASPDALGCSATRFDPPFLTFSSSKGDDVARTATDLACLATLGLDGCTIEQPLESLLKSVWPASSTEVTFVGETMTGQAGPGAPNGDFFQDPASVIALVVVTDEEDCSASKLEFLRPGASMGGIGTRCYFESQRPESSLFGVERYIQTFKALRSDREQQVIFAGIVGVPAHLTSPDATSQYDFSQPSQASAYFDMLLSAPEMQQTLDPRGNMDPADDRLVPSCDRGGEEGRAYAPRRIVQVAKGFGENGIIQSICRDDLRPAIDSILDAISKQLGAPCLPSPIPRASEGLVDCHMLWEMGSSSGEVEQLAVRDGDVAGGEGWYYDDFSDETQLACSGASKQRIAFTDDALPPEGATTRLHCFVAEHEVESGRTDLLQSVQQPKIGSRCDRVTLRNRELEGDEACIQLLSSGDEDDSLFCDDETKECALSCFEDADCPELWFCDDTAETVDRAGRAMCSPGTCSAGPTSASAEMVGDRCLPLFVPEDGFEDTIGYVEGNHPYCDGGACLVYHLGGDPREDCQRRALGPDPVRCASPDEVVARTYCSCRCDAPDGFAECACPDGFSCVDLIEHAPDEIAGGYCVRNGSIAR